MAQTEWPVSSGCAGTCQPTVSRTGRRRLGPAVCQEEAGAGTPSSEVTCNHANVIIRFVVEQNFLETNSTYITVFI